MKATFRRMNTPRLDLRQVDRSHSGVGRSLTSTASDGFTAYNSPTLRANKLCTLCPPLGAALRGSGDSLIEWIHQTEGGVGKPSSFTAEHRIRRLTLA